MLGLPVSSNREKQDQGIPTISEVHYLNAYRLHCYCLPFGSHLLCWRRKSMTEMEVTKYFGAELVCSIRFLAMTGTYYGQV